MEITLALAALKGRRLRPAAIGPGIGIGIATYGLCTAAARQPEMKGTLMGYFFIGAAMSEALALLGWFCSSSANHALDYCMITKRTGGKRVEAFQQGSWQAQRRGSVRVVLSLCRARRMRSLPREVASKAILPEMSEFIPMLVAFIILWIVLAKFGWPVFDKMLEKRANTIATTSKNAEEARQESEARAC